MLASESHFEVWEGHVIDRFGLMKTQGIFSGICRLDISLIFFS